VRSPEARCVRVLVLNVLGQHLEFVAAEGRVADTCDRGIVAGEVDAPSGARDGLERGVGGTRARGGATLRQRLRVAGDGVELGALREQGVADRRDDLADDGDVVVRDGVEALRHGALDAVLDGNDAAVVFARGDGVDDRRDRLAEVDLVAVGDRVRRPV